MINNIYANSACLNAVNSTATVLVEAPRHRTLGVNLGQQEVARLLNILIERGAILKGGLANLSVEQIKKLSQAALELEQKAKNLGDQTHLGEHQSFASNPIIAAELKKLGLSEARIQMLILIHDLGKSFEAKKKLILEDDSIAQIYKTRLTDFQAALKSAFPHPKDDFLAREILSHEFGSMIILEALGDKLGINPGEIKKLQAEIAGHNAGYDPRLDRGPNQTVTIKHFWQDTWPMFVNRLREHGYNIPESLSKYPALTSAEVGGSPEMDIVVANDRLVSWTLASQSKFAATWVHPIDVTTGRPPVSPNKGQIVFSNTRAHFELQANLGAVKQEFLSVIANLETFVGPEKMESMRAAMLRYYRNTTSQLEVLSMELLQMGRLQEQLEGSPYADRPPTTSQELNTSIVYKTKTGTWYRVAATGEVFEGKEKAWVPVPGKGPVANGAGFLVAPRLFEEIIFPDVNFVPAKLGMPDSITNLTVAPRPWNSPYVSPPVDNRTRREQPTSPALVGTP